MARTADTSVTMLLMEQALASAKGYKQLIVWQEAKMLALKIYDVTRSFSKEEQFHLVAQMRRAATSVMANVAEGSAMPTAIHRKSYYVRARGSLVEVDNFVELAFALQYIPQPAYEDLEGQIARLRFLATNLINSQKE